MPMVRRWLLWCFISVSTLILVLALLWPAVLWAFALVLPVAALGFRDALQREHTVLRNFPIIGHIRYGMEAIRPEIQQYLVESNIDAFPIEREFRALAYQRAKGELDTRPFGTQRDVYAVGYEWASHSLAARTPEGDPPRVRIGGPDCTQPYESSVLNISAMSFGALSGAALKALNGGARIGGFAHNTGEGGLAAEHLSEGGDLIWQIGTGYFGCRQADGSFDPERFAVAAG
ncbi:MAG TPA: glutamate synthase-related protein, partial [Pseudomonadales bacterium]|nr:glutamate synthase-related protein [Pseudomonadales bacterium]